MEETIISQSVNAAFTPSLDKPEDASATTYRAPYTVSLFIQDRHAESYIVGPVGSGKTVGGIMKMVYVASRQAKSKNGKRKTRFAVVRDTYEALKMTTMKSFFDWFPPGEAGDWISSQKTFILRIGDVEAEIIWLGLDDERDVRRLLSLELTGVFFDEFVFIRRDIVEAAAGRVGRYPSVKDGGPTWYGVWGSSNVGSVADWWYEYLYKEVPSDPIRANEMRLFTQPGARTREAENVENLTPDYYGRFTRTRTAEWLAQYLDCVWQPAKGGKPVHPMFRRAIHVSPYELIPNPAFPLLIGYDPGVSYSGLVFGQHDHINNRVMLLEHGFILENIGTERMIRDVLNPLLARQYRAVAGRVLMCLDPAVRNRSAGNESSSYDYIKAAKLQATFDMDNSIGTRLAQVDSFLSRNTNLGPALVVDPRNKVVIDGFEYGYRYKLSRAGVKSEVPEKNQYSHPMDGVQYICLNAPKSLSAVNRATDSESLYRPTSGNIYRT